MINITKNVERFIKKVAEMDAKDKLFKAIHFIKTNNINIWSAYEYNRLSIILLNDDNEVGHFYINDFLQTNNLSIFIEDTLNGINFQGKQLARLLIASMIYQLQEKHLNSSVLLAIDADASDGFWDKIGMIENNSTNPLIEGYEKIISLENISLWALGKNVFLTKNVIKSPKTRTLSKSKSRTRTRTLKRSRSRSRSRSTLI